MLLPGKSPSAEERRLLKQLARLAPKEREMVHAFVEFLAQRGGAAQQPRPETAVPKQIERPAEESVVAAIKRLKATYYMLDSDQLLTETSSLMTAHVMHGQGAVEVIDQLETLFERHYNNLRSDDPASSTRE